MRSLDARLHDCRELFPQLSVRINDVFPKQTGQCTMRNFPIEATFGYDALIAQNTGQILWFGHENCPLTGIPEIHCTVGLQHRTETRVMESDFRYTAICVVYRDSKGDGWDARAALRNHT